MKTLQEVLDHWKPILEEESKINSKGILDLWNSMKTANSSKEAEEIALKFIRVRDPRLRHMMNGVEIDIKNVL